MLLALLSPAKKLAFGSTPKFVHTTTPALLDDTAILAALAKSFTRDDLRRLMDLSPALADLNYQRFQSFDPVHAGEAHPAIYAFAGDVYVGFDAQSLEKDDLTFAQKHIAIISGLYGYLRPLDAIQPYRLEMGSKVRTARGKDLYAFWREPLTNHVNAIAEKLKNPTIINLASTEYWSALDTKALRTPALQVVFREIKGGKASVVSFLAKKARGLMARYIVQHRLKEPKDLKNFNAAGYCFDRKASSESVWVFSREAP